MGLTAGSAGLGRGAGSPALAVVLAAGRALRFGAPKVLLPWGGRPILAHVAAALRGAGLPVVVVTGPSTPPLGTLPEDLGFTVVHNPDAASGMASSIRAGVRAAEGVPERAQVAPAILIALGDQPGISAAAASAVARACAPGRPAVPVYRGRRGHPVAFPRDLFPELLRLSGDRGAREVLERHPPIEVLFDMPAPPDVDTPADYLALADAAPAARPAVQKGRMQGPSDLGPA